MASKNTISKNMALTKAPTEKTIKLYHGDNGHQEFWESSKHEVLLLRVKHSLTIKGVISQSEFWQIWLKGKVQMEKIDEHREKTVGAFSEGDCAEILLKKYNIHVNFSHEKAWVEQNMKLVKIQ